MNWNEIIQFFHHNHQDDVQGELIVGSYDISLVVISLIVPIVMSLMALHAANIAQIVKNKKTKHLSVAVSSLAMGTGVWAMHFIGMLAFKLPAPVGYNTSLTLISIIPSLLASWFAMRLLASRKIRLTQLIVGGILVGLGIGSMHFVGMLAMETELFMTHELDQVLWSVVIAVVLAVIALWISFGLKPYVKSTLLRFMVSSVVMGIAIAGMHYMAMTAVRFYGQPTQFQDTVLLNYKLIAYALASLSLAVGLVVFALNNYYKTAQMFELIDESKIRLRAIIDTVVDAIITIDSKGHIQEFSPAAERLLGYTADEVYGKNVKMLMPDPYRSEHDGYLENYLNTRKPRIIGIGRDVTAQRKDGTLLPIRLSVGKMELPNDEMIFVGLISDISKQIKLESELRETAEKAERAATIKSNFMANISHEIRTPMNAIIGFTELLMQSDLSDSQRNQLNIVYKSSNSLLRLINDVLVSSKLDSGKVELEELDFSLKSLAMQLQSTFNLAADKNNIYLKLHYPDNMPTYFKGDSLRLLQVMNNLVGNAVKFTEQGGIDIYFTYEEPNVTIRVKDTGIGMTTEQIEGIFNPFSQADASISRRFGGTGLGTTIARQLVNAMQGHIHIASVYGQGSEFTVILPLKLGEKPIQMPEDLNISIEKSLNVLAVDDVNDNLELLEIVLKDYGHSVTRANDGQEAFDKYLKAKFDVILMDVHMPGIDGLQATQIIRQHERSNNLSPIAIIALSASVLDDDKIKALKSGMNGFAQKPINIANLFNEITKVINHETNDTPVKATDIASEIETKDADDTVTQTELWFSQLNGDTDALTINWDMAVSLWGSQHVLARKITGLINDIDTKYTALNIKQGDVDRKALELELHGLRGVAGNLGLDRLFNLASKLESCASNADNKDLLMGLACLKDEVAAIANAINQKFAPDNANGYSENSPTNSDNKHSGITADSSKTVDTDELKEKITCLIKSFKSFEYDDELLTYVCDNLRLIGYYDEARKVRCSAEEFNFDRACSVLEDMQL